MILNVRSLKLLIARGEPLRFLKRPFRRYRGTRQATDKIYAII